MTTECIVRPSITHNQCRWSDRPTNRYGSCGLCLPSSRIYHRGAGPDVRQANRRPHNDIDGRHRPRPGRAARPRSSGDPPFGSAGRAPLRVPDVATVRGLESGTSFQGSTTTGDVARASPSRLLVLGAQRHPDTLIETGGRDYLKNPVNERFTIVDRNASWKNSAEQGTRALPAGAAAFYLSFDGAPAELGVLARALLVAPDRTLKLLPEGEARIERVGTLEAKANGSTRSVTHYEISGLSFMPSPVWLDDDGALFAQGSEWMMIVREGWESAVKTLLTAQSQRTDTLRETWARTLPRKPRGPLVFAHCRDRSTRRPRENDPRTPRLSYGRSDRAGRAQDGSVPDSQKDCRGDGCSQQDGLARALGHARAPRLRYRWCAEHRGRRFEPSSHRDLANEHRNAAGGAPRRSTAREAASIGSRRVISGRVRRWPGSVSPHRPRVLVDTPDEAYRKAIDRYKELGYEQIKVYSSIKPELVPAIIEQAHRPGDAGQRPCPGVHDQAEQVVESWASTSCSTRTSSSWNFLADSVKDTATAGPVHGGGPAMRLSST